MPAKTEKTATLAVTAKGQVTLRKELLKHLGVGPGDKVELSLLPDRKVEIHAAKPAGSWDRLFGMLAGKTTKVATLEELTEAAQQGWAGLR